MIRTKLFASVLLSLLVSCQSLSESTASKEAIYPSFERVIERHDVYVRRDDTIDAGARSSALLESRLLLNLFEGPGETVDLGFLRVRSRPVLSRYEVYVQEDEELTEFQRRVHLNTAKVLRDQILERR